MTCPDSYLGSLQAHFSFLRPESLVAYQEQLHKPLMNQEQYPQGIPGRWILKPLSCERQRKGKTKKVGNSGSSQAQTIEKLSII